MSVRVPPQAPVRTVAFSDVTPDQWNALAKRRIYFAHQSVGGNIAAGIADVLKDNPNLSLRLVEASTIDAHAAPALYHARLGRNGAPETKTEAFTGVVDAGSPDVGVLKYCYVDVDVTSNPDKLFEHYVTSVDALKQRHPALSVVHVTMPLTTIESNEGRREWLKAKLLRRPTEGERKKQLNSIRNRYNALLLEKYAGKEPVFDLAAIESTRPDGSRVFFQANGDTVYYLAPEYTDDGSHLNASASRNTGAAFLALLATMRSG